MCPIASNFKLIDKRVWLIVILLAVLNYPYSVIVYNHLGEDAFITFRYTENFVAGHGLVYNPGERVEGFSNFLWLLILAFFHKLGFGLLTTSKVLAVTVNSLLMVVATLALGTIIRQVPGDRKSVPWGVASGI